MKLDTATERESLSLANDPSGKNFFPGGGCVIAGLFYREFVASGRPVIRPNVFRLICSAGS
jgi:hypothetical protein